MTEGVTESRLTRVKRAGSYGIVPIGDVGSGRGVGIQRIRGRTDDATQAFESLALQGTLGVHFARAKSIHCPDRGVRAPANLIQGVDSLSLDKAPDAMHLAVG